MKNRPGITKKRIFLVDDHHIVRMGLTQLINREEDLMVCGEADDCEKAALGIASLVPDIAIIDIVLGEYDGLNLISSIKEQNQGVLFLVLSMHDEELYAERAIRAGASGYVMKQAAAETVIAAIRKVMKGDIYLSAAMTERFLHQMLVEKEKGVGPRLESLSVREREVFQLIGSGWSTKEIAGQLELSAKTIETYRDKIKMKLEIKSSPELLRLAIAVAKKDLQ